MILIPHRENDPSPFEFPLSKFDKLQQTPVRFSPHFKIQPRLE